MRKLTLKVLATGKECIDWWMRNDWLYFRRLRKIADKGKSEECVRFHGWATFSVMGGNQLAP